MPQGYAITIHAIGSDAAGGAAEIAIMDGAEEVGRELFHGKVSRGGAGYRRLVSGKPGLTAKLVSGNCDFSFQAECARL